MGVMSLKNLPDYHVWRCSLPQKSRLPGSRVPKSFPIYDQPKHFLSQLARNYQIGVEEVPFELAIDRYLSYLEEAKIHNICFPGRFFAVATILMEKYSEVVLGFSHFRVQALIDHLILINRHRPQAAAG